MNLAVIGCRYRWLILLPQHGKIIMVGVGLSCYQQGPMDLTMPVFEQFFLGTFLFLPNPLHADLKPPLL